MSTNNKDPKVSRRRMLRTLAGSVVVAGVTACSSAPSSDTSPQASAAQSGAAQSGAAQSSAPAQTSGVTLQFITPAAVGRERELYQGFIDQFQQANPDIKVNVSFEAWADYMTKLPTILASGAVPDVIHQHVSIVQDYGARGALLDLTTFMQRDNVKPEDYIPALFESFGRDGKTFAIPKDSAAWGIYYNKAMFDAAGLPYPKDDWTLEDFRNYAVELTRDQNGNPASSPNFDRANIKQFGFTWLEPTPTTTEATRAFLKAFGGDWYNPEYTETLITQPAALEYFQMMETLRCQVNATPQAAQAASQGDPFRSGLVAMIQSFHVMDYFMREEKITFPYDVTYMPSGPGGQFVPVGASGWAIPAKAQNPEASWKLVQYLTSVEVQRAIGEIGRWGVARKEAIDAIIPENPISGFAKVHVDPLQGKSDREVIGFRFPAKQSEITQVYQTELTPHWDCSGGDLAETAARAKEQIDAVLQQ
jgi:multiple sugar transport system substrate-binding protein